MIDLQENDPTDFLESRDSMPSYREIAESLDRSEAAVKQANSRDWSTTGSPEQQAVYELRKRYRGILLREVAETLAEGERAEDELRYLLGVFSE